MFCFWSLIFILLFFMSNVNRLNSLQTSIWMSVDEGSVSSMQSLDGDPDSRLFTMPRDSSLDRYKCLKWYQHVWTSLYIFNFKISHSQVQNCKQIFFTLRYSRLSGGSTQSDVLPAEKKKKKSIFGKLKKLTKSRSVDDHVENAEVVDFRPISTVSQVILSCQI